MEKQQTKRGSCDNCGHQKFFLLVDEEEWVVGVACTTCGEVVNID